jgi:hypothetical protein
MAIAKFQFGAQPALDRAVADKRAKEKALQSALQELQRAHDALAAQTSARAVLEQSASALRHELASGRIGSVSVEDLSATLRLLTGVRARIDMADRAIRDRKAALRIVEQRVVSYRRDLSRATSAAESLERFRANLVKEHTLRAQREQEQSHEDDAAQHWNFRKAPGK